MLTFKRISLAAFISLALLAVVGCPQHKSIADIQRDPAYYATREVAVEGRVTHSFGALGTGIYEIDDGTGKLWVFAESTGVPSDGTKVGVQGTVIPTFTFGGKSFASGIRETKHRSHR